MTRERVFLISRFVESGCHGPPQDRGQQCDVIYRTHRLHGHRGKGEVTTHERTDEWKTKDLIFDRFFNG